MQAQLTVLVDCGITPAEALSNALSPTYQPSDLYTLSLRRITLFKSGASFSEHSPLLHSLSQLPSFQKPHSGLQKMFLGEVAGKRVVVQGLWIGGWCWGDNMPKIHTREWGEEGGDKPTTKAPWVGDGRREMLERTKGGWVSAVPPRQ